MDDAQKEEEEDQKEMAPVELDSTTLPEVSGSNYETGAVDEGSLIGLDSLWNLILLNSLTNWIDTFLPAPTVSHFELLLSYLWAGQHLV